MQRGGKTPDHRCRYRTLSSEPQNYCLQWLHAGKCKHECEHEVGCSVNPLGGHVLANRITLSQMPNRPKLERLGFKSVPAWWLDERGRGTNPGFSSYVGPRTRSSRAQPPRLHWKLGKLLGHPRGEKSQGKPSKSDNFSNGFAKQIGKAETITLVADPAGNELEQGLGQHTVSLQPASSLMDVQMQEADCGIPPMEPQSNGNQTAELVIR